MNLGNCGFTELVMQMSKTLCNSSNTLLHSQDNKLYFRAKKLDIAYVPFNSISNGGHSNTKYNSAGTEVQNFNNSKLFYRTFHFYHMLLFKVSWCIKLPLTIHERQFGVLKKYNKLHCLIIEKKVQIHMGKNAPVQNKTKQLLPRHLRVKIAVNNF